MDDFDDDELDNLDVRELETLESNAIQATQAKLQANETNYFDLTTDVEFTQSPPRQSQVVTGAAEPRDSTSGAHLKQRAGSATNKSFVGQQREQPQLQQRHYQQENAIGTQFVRQPLHGADTQGETQFRTLPRAGFGSPIVPVMSQSNGPVPENKGNDALLKRVRELESELNAARGEVAIVRAKNNNIMKDHNQEVQRLKNMHAEQLAQYQTAVATAKQMHTAVVTELQFARRDLREDVSRAQRDDSTTREGRPFTGIGDGFSRADLMGPRTSQSNTKKRASLSQHSRVVSSSAKRRRPVEDTPITPLDLQAPLETVRHESGVGEQPQGAAMSQGQQTQPTVEIPAVGLHPLEYVKMLLDHRRNAPHETGPSRTFEALSKYALPSEPETPFTSLYLQKIPEMCHTENSTTMLVDFVMYTVGLWNECVGQQYYEPLSDLLGLVEFVLYLKIEVVPSIMTWFVTVAQTTCLTIFKERFLAETENHSKLVASEEYSRLIKHIDVPRILSAVHFVALACSSEQLDSDYNSHSLISELWTTIDPQLILKGLHPKQHLADGVAILRLLQTSVLPESIGIVTSSESPVIMVDQLLERIASQLIAAQSTVTIEVELHVFTLTGLQTLLSFSTTSFGLTRLAACPRLINQLVSILNIYLNKLYFGEAPLDEIIDRVHDPHIEGTRTGCLFPGRKIKKLPGFEQSQIPSIYDIIGASVLLLHTIIMSPETKMLPQLVRRLKQEVGTWERSLVALSRLEYNDDDLVIGQGLGPETVYMAHELLNEMVAMNPSLQNDMNSINLA